ncbi:dihydrodipicolinate reductase [Winogradskyella eximia]|jgi:4-hydroxy-tetrahydrodipicolinate reductase|uniref:4-hydroxy-tetrahydrodipicolinate reductase n=1 Tax=Winogradskyella eximia TaxID=262006 RepID=A0A3D9H0L4_9FLAO|nr:4-hydroxy-tetrahydrodipicolinate reductase [Winogradskyella eximia]RED43043.1 dihydrodipicolinate reductase [Winogradskyella eximia]|tara:strand:- start:7451 stop:8152 length:702 start_codon:yes stop_codon:yes gene_type:complete
MKIALLGYGKMGKSIETIALNRNHTISLIVSDSNSDYDFSNSDVAIDFSIPSVAVSNIKKAIDAGIPVISGTTGWLEQYQDVLDYCNSNNGTFLYASNFSLGVNIFFELNKRLSELMSNTSEYTTEIEEIHHTQKLDAPSGTAITLAEQIIENTEYTNWTLDEPKPNEIHIEAKRIENVPGTHEISYNSEIDSINIKHTAHSRQGFAMGAVIAAEWIKDKKGVFSMKDVLNIG